MTAKEMMAIIANESCFKPKAKNHNDNGTTDYGLAQVNSWRSKEIKSVFGYTMEDLLEEIVGEIHDEYDEDDQTWQKVGKNEWIFEARTSLSDFCKATGLDLNDDLGDKADNCESIGGLMLEVKQNFLRIHEVLRFRNIEFTVISMDKRRIDRVRVKFL